MAELGSLGLPEGPKSRSHPSPPLHTQHARPCRDAQGSRMPDRCPGQSDARQMPRAAGCQEQVQKLDTDVLIRPHEARHVCNTMTKQRETWGLEDVTSAPQAHVRGCCLLPPACRLGIKIMFIFGCLVSTQPSRADINITVTSMGESERGRPAPPEAHRNTGTAPHCPGRERAGHLQGDVGCRQSLSSLAHHPCGQRTEPGGRVV